MALSVWKKIQRGDVFQETYRILETYDSIDGTRTRVSHRVFSNEDEALAFAENPAPDFPEEPR